MLATHSKLLSDAPGTNKLCTRIGNNVTGAEPEQSGGGDLVAAGRLSLKDIAGMLYELTSLQL